MKEVLDIHGNPWSIHPEYGDCDEDVRKFLSRWNEPKDSQVLEVGANQEWSANILTDNGWRFVSGVDLFEGREGHNYIHWVGGPRLFIPRFRFAQTHSVSPALFEILSPRRFPVNPATLWRRLPGLGRLTVDWLMNLARFLAEALRLAFAGGPAVLFVAKWTGLILAFYLDVAEGSKLKISLVTGQQEPQELSVPWLLPFGMPFTALAVAILLLIAGGLAYARFARMEIRGVQASNGHKRIAVRNRTGSEVTFGACLDTIDPIPKPYPWDGARFQIDGVEPPFLEGKIPPYKTALVNVLAQPEPEEPSDFLMLLARHPVILPVKTPIKEYSLKVCVFPTGQTPGGPVYDYFRIVPNKGGVDLVGHYPSSWKSDLLAAANALTKFVITLVPPVVGIGIAGIPGLAFGAVISVAVLSLVDC